jgi:hypothetical protein
MQNAHTRYRPRRVCADIARARPGKGSWNYYFEHQTSVVYDDWPGSAVENSYRFKVTYTIPPF